MLEWLQMIFLGHSHKWEEDSRERNILILKCTVCGKRKTEEIRGWTPPANEGPCQHQWETFRQGAIHDPGKQYPVGHYEDQKCKLCGDVRHIKLVN